MPIALSVCLPLVTAAVLIVSGIAKLRTSDSLGGWRQLGVPEPLRREWLLRAHPWVEIVLGAAVALLGGPAGVVVGIAAAALLTAYTALIVRAVRAESDASCACFGERTPVTGMTAIRNVWLTLVTIGAAVAVGWAPVAGGAVRLVVQSPAWLAALVIVAATAVLVMHRATGGRNDAMLGEADAALSSEEQLDYLRRRTPAVPVTLADGTVVNLRQLAAQKPILLLAVSPFCGACGPVIASQERFAELLPELDIRLLLTAEPELSPLTQRAEPQSLHDRPRYVSGSIADWPTPTAVLLGTDGMLAGGPESGSTAIDAFVDDIYESLHGYRPGEGPEGEIAGDGGPPAPVVDALAADGSAGALAHSDAAAAG
jgi:hypothetical protein